MLVFVGIFWKFVDTCKPTSMPCPFVPTKYLLYRQNIERNSSFRMWKCQKCLSSLASLARIYIHFLNVSVLSVYCHLYNSIIIIKDKRKMHWLCYVYVCITYVIWDLKMNVFLRQSIWSTNKILKEIYSRFGIWKCENFLTSLARSHIHRFFVMLVFCQYSIVYSAIP